MPLNAAATFLQVGDEFALMTEPSHVAYSTQAGDTNVAGFLTANNQNVTCDFVNASCAAPSPPHQQAARFLLHTANQYTSAKHLRAAEVSKDQAGKLGALRSAAGMEQKQNKNMMKSQTGHTAVFGQTVQLLSTASAQFVRMEKLVAAEDDTALRCSLASDAKRSKLMHFKILPAFATRNEGTNIRMGDTVILEAMRDGLQMHCEFSNAEVGDTREANVAVSGTPL